MIEISTLWAVILAIVGLVLTVMNIFDKAMGFRDRAKKPEQDFLKDYALWKATTDNDICSIKNQLLVHERSFNQDKEKIEEMRMQMKTSNIVIIQSLKSLIDFSLDSNNKELLVKANADLDAYLINGKE